MHEVAGVVLPNIVAELRRRGLDPAPFFAGLSFSAAEAAQPPARLPWNEYAMLVDRLAEAFGGPAAMTTLGWSFYERPEFRLMTKVLALALSPPRLIDLMTRWAGPSLVSCMHATSVEWRDASHVEVRLALAPGATHSVAFFYIVVGTWEATFHHGGYPGTVVTYRPEVDPNTIAVHVPAGARLVELPRRLVRYVGAGRHARAQLFEQQAELNETVRALRESEGRYRAMVEQTRDLVWRYDTAAGRMSFISPVAEALTGWTPAELSGMRLAAFVHPEDYPRAVAALRRGVTGEADRFEVEVRHMRKDGTWFWSEVVGHGVREGGRVAAVQGATRDISARKEAESERVRALAAEAARDELAREIERRVRVEAELVEAKERAEALTRVKDSIMANLSHEIRTPMTALIGFAQLLGIQLRGTSHEAAVSVMYRSGRRLLILLNNMLDLARADAGMLAADVVDYPIERSVEQVCTLLEVQARDKGLAFRFEAEPGLVVKSDPRRDEQILLNLIGNAIRYTESGEINVSTRRDGDWCRLEVRDTGIGIGEDFLPHLFEEFRQESEGINRRHEGSGLGLALTKRLIDVLGGSIAVASRKHAGTTVTVRLPLGRAPVPAPQDEAPRAVPVPGVAGPRPRVLVAEDDPACLSFIGDALADLADVTCAATAEEALAAAQAAPFDGALLDIHFKGAGMSGVELVRALSDAGVRPGNVTAMTAQAMPGDRDRLLAAGFDAYVAKPADYDDLVAWVQALAAAAPRHDAE